jgi:uncharacterized protein (TIGR00725 family)
MYISVIGGSKCSSEIYLLAERLGEELAHLGATVISGGLGGIMEAVSKGVQMNGGTTIGILPSDNKEDGNNFLDYALVTGMGQARNVLIVLNGDLVIAINGAYGTLSEIALALKFNKTVLGLKSWDIPSVKNFDTVKEVICEIKKMVH